MPNYNLIDVGYPGAWLMCTQTCINKWNSLLSSKGMDLILGSESKDFLKSPAISFHYQVVNFMLKQYGGSSGRLM